MTNAKAEDYPSLAERTPEKEFAALGVSFMMVAPKIKALVDYAEAEGPPSKQKLAAEIKKALFSPVDVQIVEPTEDALELARQYKEFIEQG